MKYSPDVVIFGGGIAGLWALDTFISQGYSALLLENSTLGNGQTICAQGIVHGGFKYVVPGKYRQGSASEVRNMPDRWRAHLSGQRKDPDLSSVLVRSPTCSFWLSQGRGLRGLLEETFSLAGLSLLTSPPVDVTDTSPAWFKASARKIYAVSEPVIDTSSLLFHLARPHASRIIYYNTVSCLASGSGSYELTVTAKSGESYTISPQRVVLSSGIGNQDLLKIFGYDEEVMQIRPLRQLLVRGNSLPDLWGHCIDGGKAVASVTTHYDSRAGEKIWSIGGEIAEKGHTQEPEELIREGRALLERLLQGVDFSQTKWGTFDALRAEEPNGNLLPSGISMKRFGIVYVCFPTKMAMAPVLADALLSELIRDGLEKYSLNIDGINSEVRVASFPWENRF